MNKQMLLNKYKNPPYEISSFDYFHLMKIMQPQAT